MVKYLLSFVTIVLFLAEVSFAQELLTKTRAIKITLENNYDIKMAENNIKVAQNNASRELNGYLPTVNANAGLNANLGGSTQKFSNGNKNTTSYAFNWGSNTSIGVDYTIIDKTRDATVKQLEEIANLTDLELRQTIENNFLTVFDNYYEVARLTQNTLVQEETIEVSKQRLQRARYQYDYGQGIRLGVLNAEVDIQRDSINLLNLKNQLANAKRNLNVAMGRAVTTPIEVETNVAYDTSLSLDQLIRNAQSDNVQMQLINKNLDISALDFDVINSSKKPILGASASYGASFSDNASGSFIDVSNSQGMAAGLTLSLNLYDGGRRKKQEENATINVASQNVQKQQILQQLKRDVVNAWESYQNALFILHAEEKNLATNQLNFQRTEEQFKIGQITSVEFRQAQLNLLDAASNLNTAKYDAKVIEIGLMHLSGGLLDGLD